MIYIVADLRDATEEEQQAAETHLKALETIGVDVERLTSTDACDEVKDMLLQAFADRQLGEGDVFGPRDFMTLAANRVFNPAQKELVDKAVSELIAEAILEGKGANSIALTKKGVRRVCR